MADYAGIPIFEVEEICYYTYRLLLREGLIDMLSRTEGGRKYLEKCWTLEQTEPDRKKLRETFGTNRREEAGSDG